MDGQARLDDDIDGIDYTRYATRRYPGSAVARGRKMAALVRRLYRDGRTLVRETRPDGLIASSSYPLEMRPAHRIARLA
jgi:hypothetical protein